MCYIDIFALIPVVPLVILGLIVRSAFIRAAMNVTKLGAEGIQHINKQNNLEGILGSLTYTRIHWGFPWLLSLKRSLVKSR